MGGKILAGALSISLLAYLAPIIAVFAASLTRSRTAFELKLYRVITVKATLRAGILC